MSPVKNVVFDLGGVMINYNPRSIIASLGYDQEKGDELCNAIFLDPVWQEMDKGIYMTYKEALPVFVSRHPELKDDILRFFGPTWMEVYTVKNDTEEILFNWVADKGLDIYALSNYAADGFEYVRQRHRFFRRMKGYVVSAFEREMKPQPRIYQILLERYSLVPEETVFIDDLQANVDTANSLGMRGIRFTDPMQVRRELEAMGV